MLRTEVGQKYWEHARPHWVDAATLMGGYGKLIQIVDEEYELARTTGKN
jgi:hypothetical protein